MIRLWLGAAILSLTMFGCSSESDSGGNNDVACFVCGPGVMCGEACNDACGCCCDSGEERVQDGELHRCTVTGCWEVAGPAPADAGADMSQTDMGQTDMAQTDMGSMSDADGGADAGLTACTEAPNGDSPPTDTCTHGAADWIAWRWVAPRDMEVQTIRMHTDEGFGAFFADATEKPGAVLFEGALSAADADGWREFTAPTPVSVTQGATYWIGEDVSTCSTAENGNEWEYYTSDSTSGPWSGPFTGHPFTARLVGRCP